MYSSIGISDLNAQAREFISPDPDIIQPDSWYLVIFAMAPTNNCNGSAGLDIHHRY